MVAFLDRNTQPERNPVMTTTTRRSPSVDAMLTGAAKLKNPTTRLERIAAARTAHAATSDRLGDATTAAILAARAAGITWQAIGTILDISAQRAQQLARTTEEVAS